MKRKRPKLSSLLFAILLVLLIVPQTRLPIQVAVNKVKLWVWSPSAVDQEDQTQVVPFAYELSDITNTPHSIEIGKGKVTFISYWATWCPPCIAELPSIEKLYADYGDQVHFVLITNEEPAVVSNFLKRKNYNLPVYFPQMKTPDQLYDRSIPTNFLIGKSGNIIIKETGAADWNSAKVHEILKIQLNN